MLTIVCQCQQTGDFFIASFQCPHHVERIGALGDGGKWVCGVERLARQKKCVIYSFGASPGGRHAKMPKVLTAAHLGCRIRVHRHQRRIIIRGWRIGARSWVRGLGLRLFRE